MDLLKTLVSLVTGLAWPVAVVWIVLTFRREIRDVLRSRITKVKAGPFELAIEQARVEVDAASVVAGSTASGESAPALIELHESIRAIVSRAESNPHAAVISAFELIDQALLEKLDAAGVDRKSASGAVQLASLAASAGVITNESVDSVQGVAVLRNLAAHGHGGEIDTARALDYLSLIEATLYAIRWTPR